MFSKLILTKTKIEAFIVHGCLNYEEAEIVKLRTAKVSREKIADKLHISVSTLDKRIKHLKDVYDEVQRQHPELELPTRLSD